ncbi:MAG TPA: hypothetical protein VHJ20_07680 [Polyangia bacterium]|nr:hypothetical protein [Polyangia bacterium]
MPEGKQKPWGAGAFGAACVVFALGDETAAVEMADAKKKTPASAIPLSIVFSCGDVGASDAGPSLYGPAMAGDEVHQQPAHHRKTLRFRRQNRVFAF